MPNNDEREKTRIKGMVWDALQDADEHLMNNNIDEAIRKTEAALACLKILKGKNK